MIEILAYNYIFPTASCINDTISEQPYVSTPTQYLRSKSKCFNDEINVSLKIHRFIQVPRVLSS